MVSYPKRTRTSGRFKWWLNRAQCQWRSGSIAPANPWSAKSLEWQTLTPVPLENFLEDVTVVNDAYGYGERAELQVHAVFGSTSDAHHGEGH